MIFILVVEQLNELHVNLLGKIFVAALGAWVIGRATGLKIRGTPSEIQAVSNAMLSSRRFQDELKRSGATVQSVINKLNLKNASKAEFERILGISFPI